MSQRETASRARLFCGPVLPFRRRDRADPGYRMAARGDVGEVYIYDVIGDTWDGSGLTARSFAGDLKALGAVKTLNVYINSPGGSVFDGVAIYNQLRRHAARKVVQIDGIAASIASVVAMAGDQIDIAVNGMVMIHDPWALAVGTAADMRKTADSLDKVREAILNTYVERTGKPAESLSSMMSAETWMTAQEAVDNGFADGIVQAADLAALAGFDLSGFRHVPEPLKEAAATKPAEPAPQDASPAAQPVAERRVAARHPAIDAARATLAGRGR